MNTEMILPGLTLGILGLVSAIYNSRMTSMERRLSEMATQQREDHRELLRRIDAANAQQRQDHQHLVSLILQTRGIRQEEPA